MSWFAIFRKLPDFRYFVRSHQITLKWVQDKRCHRKYLHTAILKEFYDLKESHTEFSQGVSIWSVMGHVNEEINGKEFWFRPLDWNYGILIMLNLFCRRFFKDLKFQNSIIPVWRPKSKFCSIDNFMYMPRTYPENLGLIPVANCRRTILKFEKVSFAGNRVWQSCAH